MTEAPTIVFPAKWTPAMIAGWLLVYVPSRGYDLVIPVEWRDSQSEQAWRRVFGVMPDLERYLPHAGRIEHDGSEFAFMYLRHEQAPS